MGNLFNKGNSGSEEPQDFVLFNSDDTASESNISDNNENTDAPTETVESVHEDQTTISINLDAVNEAIKTEDKPQKKQKVKKVKKPKKAKKPSKISGKRKIMIICIASVLAVVILTGSVFGVMVLSNPLYKYSQVAAEKASIMRTFDVSGTLESGDKYNITSLVYGKIEECHFEIGDEVKAGDLLYKIDDTEAQLAVERAKNEVDRAKDPSAASSSPSLLKIVASESGKIEKINIQTGSSVYPGAQIGTYTKADGSNAAIISYVSGSISAVSVRNGQSLSPGQVIATVTPANATSNKNTTYDKKGTEIDLKSAEQNLENYKITSPVDGIIIEINNKVGDNVGITDSEKPMMVILDTSSLKFTFNVDEHQVNQFKSGQSVSVSAVSKPDTDYSGNVVFVSSEGIIDENGAPRYNVTVSVEEPDGLKSGMSVSGKVVLDSKQNVLSVPEKALMESDGKNALVFIKSDNPENADNDISQTLENELNYPWIKIPKGCELISVKYGLSDGINVQILSGIELGDIVVYDPDNEYTLIPSSISDAKSNERNNVLDTDDEDDMDDTDEELEQAIRKQLENLSQM